LKSFLSVDQLSKSYGNNIILNQISLEINKGEFFFLLGPSGCGKTTLLRCISGLVDHESGTIELEGNSIHHLPAHKRDVNTVFQNYALFPHMSVSENVGFGLKMKGKSKNEIRSTVGEMLNLVKLVEFKDRYPAQLSGGQMQRVALARALANRPSLLLLDEPLGALDVKLRKQMQDELRRIQKDLGITFICVTHDQEEALSIGDRIAVMNNGCLEQIGTSEELYNRPKSEFVCDFLGESNFMDVLVVSSDSSSSRMLIPETSHYVVAQNTTNQAQAKIAIRPENISISTQSQEITAINNLPVQILDIRFSGPFFEIFTQTSIGTNIVVRVPSDRFDSSAQIGNNITLSWLPEHVIILS
jgi:spermidine/putrescine transport system ATP-binding protein